GIGGAGGVHVSEPNTTPAARASAQRRPCDMAVDKMAMLLGPGLTTPTAYAAKATAWQAK
ncbi:MAG: hypothetical protein ACR2I0_13590, partial [Rhodoferax sp.]